MITLEDWALIRRLVADGVSQRQVAKQLGIARGTVARAVASGRPPKYERAPRATSFAPFEARVRALLRAEASLPASVLAERVGWVGSMTWFREHVRRLRPEALPVDPVDRLSWAAGDAAQCDLWFPATQVPLEDGSRASLPVLVMVPAYSRLIAARMLPTRRTEDLLLGSWSLIQAWGRVPRRLIWDNEPGIGRRGRLAEGVAAFTGALATRIVQLKPFDPESKGIVERANGYLASSFLPGRSFRSPADFNEQLSDWLQRANARWVRSLKARPIDLIDTDRASMLPLPPVPVPLGWRQQIRLGRDYYVRVDTSDYSVDPSAIGRMIEVTADLERVHARFEGRAIAEHARVWARGITVSDALHIRRAAALREAFNQPPPAAADPMVRDLAEYDRAFGLNEQGITS